MIGFANLFEIILPVVIDSAPFAYIGDKRQRTNIVYIADLTHVRMQLWFYQVFLDYFLSNFWLFYADLDNFVSYKTLCGI